MNLALEVMTGGVRGGTSILYAGLGETVSERAGVVNLGTEGCMLVRCARRLRGHRRDRATRGSACSPARSPAALLALGARVLRAQPQGEPARHRPRRALPRARAHVAVRRGVRRRGRSRRSRPGTSRCCRRIPWIGDIFFEHDPLTYLSYVAGPGHLVAAVPQPVGPAASAARVSAPRCSRTYGHKPMLVQYVAVVVGGLLAGIGGAQLSTAYANAWFENMTQGRGFIAVAVVIFAARQPFKVVAGAYLFGAALALSPALQARGVTHQPVRPRRGAVRRDDRRPGAARQARCVGGARGPQEGLRDGAAHLSAPPLAPHQRHQPRRVRHRARSTTPMPTTRSIHA